MSSYTRRGIPILFQACLSTFPLPTLCQFLIPLSRMISFLLVPEFSAIQYPGPEPTTFRHRNYPATRGQSRLSIRKHGDIRCDQCHFLWKHATLRGMLSCPKVSSKWYATEHIDVPHLTLAVKGPRIGRVPVQHFF